MVITDKFRESKVFQGSNWARTIGLLNCVSQGAGASRRSTSLPHPPPPPSLPPKLRSTPRLPPKPLGGGQGASATLPQARLPPPLPSPRVPPPSPPPSRLKQTSRALMILPYTWPYILLESL